MAVSSFSHCAGWQYLTKYKVKNKANKWVTVGYQIFGMRFVLNTYQNKRTIDLHVYIEDFDNWGGDGEQPHHRHHGARRVTVRGSVQA
ncbi:hypothetical protein [Microbispora rosea]|uniref:hypothetical protein n=1 Tax=Microbispora rosea TaxID=58117 RepID=UPI003431E3AA